MKTFSIPVIALAIVTGVGLGAAAIVGGQSAASKVSIPFAAPETSVSVRPIGNVKFEPSGSLHAIDDSLSQLAAYAMPAVVKIQSETTNRDILGNAGNMKVRGTGSGFIFRADGYILTNDHVVGDSKTVKVILHDGRELEGKVTRGLETDVAVVKVDAKDLPTLSLADSSKTKPGQISMAIGSPFQFDGSVTIGHVSAVNRVMHLPDRNSGLDRLYPDLIQTDAAVNTGNSGGPLINSDREVIGINTFINSESGGSNGVGFAISANQCRTISNILLAGGKIERGFMGLELTDLPLYRAKELGIEGGSLVGAADANTPGGIAGLKSGDVIVNIEGTPIKNYAGVLNMMYTKAPGSSVKVTALRNGKQQEFTVKLGSLPRLKPMDIPLFKKGEIPGGRDFDLEKLFKNRNGDDMDFGPVKFDQNDPKLGVTVDESQDKGGVIVRSVNPGSVASKLGIKVGDIISKFDDQELKSVDNLTSAIKNMKKGSHVIRWRTKLDGGDATYSRTVDY